MNVKERILENIRKQGVVQGRLTQLQQDGERLSNELHNLGGRIEILGDLLKEETGFDLNVFVQRDEEFRNQIQEASREGNEIARGTAQTPTPQPKMTTVKTHIGNKTVEPPAPVAESAPDTRDTGPEIKLAPRAKQGKINKGPPEVVIIDGPPPEPEDDDEEE